MKPISFSWLSLRQRLTLLICILLLSFAIIFGWISYFGVKKATVTSGHDRLQTLSHQVSTMLSGNIRNFILGTYTVSRRPAIKQYLLSGGMDSVAAATKLLADLRKDSLYVRVELRNADRNPLLTSVRENGNIDANIDTLLSTVSGTSTDSGKVGRLYAINNAVYFPIVSPITEKNKLLGYIVRWRQMKVTPQSLQHLSALMGTGAKLYIGNADHRLWTDMIEIVPSLFSGMPRKNTIVEYTGTENNSMIASVRTIANSNWLVVVEFSKTTMMEPANNFLYWLIAAGSILLAMGALGGWLLIRNISEPIKKLTKASSDIAAGNYSLLVQVERRDELGKLARAFNAMTAQVKKSQNELQKRAENYKLLFEKNPMPMWIIDRVHFKVLDANEAAIRHYGYSRSEFLNLNAIDLRPAEDASDYRAYANNRPNGFATGLWRHKKKDQTVIMVDVISDDIVYQDQPARIILAQDVTERLRAEAELVRHRITQQALITETTIQAQEKEREELAKELHDNVNQILASTKLYLEIAKSGNDKMLAEAISKSYDSVNLAIGEIRQLSKQLVPPSLDNTLIDAVIDLVDEIKNITSIAISLSSANFNEASLDENIKLALYRIIQEQVNNILKHAKASNVLIEISTDTYNVYLNISDDGVGFDTGKKSKGIGLRNIDSRIKFYNGTAEIKSGTGKGCKLQISVPLNRQIALAV